ncbi:MAG: hypothetical protein ABJA98_32045 [Acidobacteriota bacterium]
MKADIWACTPTGREPFDPQRFASQLAGCLLCGRPIKVVGMYIPQTPEAEAMVLRLRRHAPYPTTMPCLGYGLCKKHWKADRETTAAQVEGVFRRTAATVTVQ